MKTLNHIPTGKFRRTEKLLKTGVKLGGNYLKYYSTKLIKDERVAKDQLNEDNAEDIYNSLSELKGSALKVAQMLSMEKDLMPRAFVEKFSLSQFSVPPLSGALVRKTFRKYFGKNPEDIFDSFSTEAKNAASIGQVHQAQKDEKTFAVKIQYPGVRESISNDLKMVKPVAMRMFNIQKQGSEKYFKEVEHKLLEETDYTLELQRSREFAKVCSTLPHLKFPKYYPEYSCERIITMDWMSGQHLSEFTREEHSQETHNRLGQILWDFYMTQLHVLKKLHADPHPGNFLVSAQHELLVIDFGCIKILPQTFYEPYFELIAPRTLQDMAFFEQKLYELEFLSERDTADEKKFFTQLFHEMLELLTRPFHEDEFDFSDDVFFQQIAEMGQRYAKLSERDGMNTSRGSIHFIYVNRTLFGLYNLMHELRAQHIEINHFKSLPPYLALQKKSS